MHAYHSSRPTLFGLPYWSGYEALHIQSMRLSIVVSITIPIHFDLGVSLPFRKVFMLSTPILILVDSDDAIIHLMVIST